MMSSLISIVVPAYNAEKYIIDTMRSVLNQTYRSIEIIAVDDGSEDKTGLLLDTMAEEEPRLNVLHQENRGVARARIAGIKAASGEYIGFVDADDIIDTDMYEHLYANAVRYNADISHCGYRIVRDNGSVSYCYNSGRMIEQDNESGVRDLLEGYFIEPGLCNKLYRKSLFSSIFRDDTGFDDTIRLNEDLLMNYYLFRESRRSIYEDFCPYCYIKREGSASQSTDRVIDYLHPVKVREIIYEECKGTPEEELAEILLVSKTVHKISEISEKKGSGFDELRNTMIEIVKSHKRVIGKLPMKQRTGVGLFLYFPALYKPVNRIYRKITD